MMRTVVEEDEEIARAIRRDPRGLVGMIVFLVIAVALVAAGLVAFGRMRIGGAMAEGFSVLTDPGASDAGAARPAP